MKIRELENEAGKCYAEPLHDLDSDDFVKLLLVDGVFIVQIIRTHSENRPYYLRDMVAYCSTNSFYCSLFRDMLLLENQLPFSVIWELFRMIENSADQNMFMEAIFDMLRDVIPGKERPRDELKSFRLEEIKHLLDFTYRCCCHPSTSEMKHREKKQRGELNFIRCATELREAGIKFELAEEGNSMLDIRDILHASDYVVLMNHLIDSPKDVKILCQNGIVKSMLGDDQAVATMINGLGVFLLHSPKFYYSEVCNKINRHCSRRWNKRMANLKHNYFYSPWALLSVLAATLLLLLTLLQAVFSVLSYAK
ncbi:hypothetical protein PTKIN_Ptkin09bG0218000 [Pterospermum kingtungense]